MSQLKFLEKNLVYIIKLNRHISLLTRSRTIVIDKLLTFKIIMYIKKLKPFNPTVVRDWEESAVPKSEPSHKKNKVQTLS
jgi:hypothetical protein